MSKIDEIIKMLNNPVTQITSARIKKLPRDGIYYPKCIIDDSIIPDIEQLRPYVELGEKVAMNAEINDGIVDVLNFPLNMDLITIGLIQQIKEQQG